MDSHMLSFRQLENSYMEQSGELFPVGGNTDHPEKHQFTPINPPEVF